MYSLSLSLSLVFIAFSFDFTMERARYRIVIIQWPLSRKNWRKIKVVKRGRCKKKKKKKDGNFYRRKHRVASTLVSVIAVIDNR